MTATDALELGIDIGLLDCAISVGFPGTVASLRQQWGRAGRRDRGLAILVASRRRARPVLRARAGRAPLAPRRGRDPRPRQPEDPRPARPRRRVRGSARRGATSTRSAREALRRAAELPELERTPAGYVWKGRDYPAARVSLRSGDAEAFTVVDAETGLAPRARRARPRVLDRPRGRRLPPPRRAVPRRVALPRGSRRRRLAGSRRLVHAGEEGVGDDDRGVAARRRAARRRAPLRPRLRHRAGRRLRAEGRARRRDDRRRPHAHAGDDVRDGGDLVLPRGRTSSRGSSRCRSSSERSTPPSTASSRSSRCGRCATAGTSAASRPTSTTRPADRRSSSTTGTPAASGSPSAASTASRDWVEDTARLLQRCPCAAGCPSCVQSPKCGNLNEPLDKAGARLLLERMLAA